jgi:hypothetical protein
VNTVSIFWIVVFALATLLFFGAAFVISFVGSRDLRDLLKNTKSKSPHDA